MDTDDYESEGLIGGYLHKKGELKTISNLVEEAALGRNSIEANLANGIDKKNDNLDDLQIKYKEKTMSLSRILEEKDRIHLNFCEGLFPFLFLSFYLHVFYMNFLAYIPVRLCTCFHDAKLVLTM